MIIKKKLKSLKQLTRKKKTTMPNENPRKKKRVHDRKQGQDPDPKKTIEKKRRKKRKAKKNQKTYEEKLTDPKIIEFTKRSINLDKNIPQNMKEKFQKIETNLLALCITNQPLNITHHEIKEYFNTFTKALVPEYESKGIEPVKDVEKGSKKNYAVLYLHDKQVVETLLALENMEFQNFKLKIERPRGFFSKIYSINDEEDPLNTDQANLDEIKVYMGNIPQYMGEDDQKKLCSSFGQIKSFNLIRDYSGDVPVSKGYAFFEFVDPRVTDRAIKQLNGLEIGDKKMRVQRVTSDAPKSTLAQQMKDAQEKSAKAKEKPSNEGGSFQQNFYMIEDAHVKAMISVPQTAIVPSRVIQLQNMVSPEDLMSDEFYKDLFEDVKFECENFGSMEHLEIPRPDKKTGSCTGDVGKVFVKFHYIRSAKRAQYKLNGRPYNRRTCVASFYPEDAFDKRHRDQ